MKQKNLLRIFFMFLPFVLSGCGDIVAGSVQVLAPGIGRSMKNVSPSTVYNEWSQEHNLTQRFRERSRVCIIYNDISIKTPVYDIHRYSERRLWGFNNKINYFEKRFLETLYNVQVIDVGKNPLKEDDSCDKYYERELVYIDFSSYKKDDYSIWKKSVYWIITPVMKLTMLDKDKNVIASRTFVGKGMRAEGGPIIYDVQPQFLRKFGSWYLNSLNAFVNEMEKRG